MPTMVCVICIWYVMYDRYIVDVSYMYTTVCVMCVWCIIYDRYIVDISYIQCIHTVNIGCMQYIYSKHRMNTSKHRINFYVYSQHRRCTKYVQWTYNTYNICTVNIEYIQYIHTVNTEYIQYIHTVNIEYIQYIHTANIEYTQYRIMTATYYRMCSLTIECVLLL